MAHPEKRPSLEDLSEEEMELRKKLEQVIDEIDRVGDRHKSVEAELRGLQISLSAAETTREKIEKRLEEIKEMMRKGGDREEQSS